MNYDAFWLTQTTFCNYNFVQIKLEYARIISTLKYSVISTDNVVTFWIYLPFNNNGSYHPFDSHTFQACTPIHLTL